jgi:hypothetical protein
MLLLRQYTAWYSYIISGTSHGAATADSNTDTNTLERGLTSNVMVDIKKI